MAKPHDSEPVLILFSCEYQRNLGRLPVPGDKLIGDIIEVVADDVWPRAYSQHIVADTLNEGVRILR